jgi:hypothetical protein
MLSFDLARLKDKIKWHIDLDQWEKDGVSSSGWTLTVRPPSRAPLSLGPPTHAWQRDKANLLLSNSRNERRKGIMWGKRNLQPEIWNEVVVYLRYVSVGCQA